MASNVVILEGSNAHSKHSFTETEKGAYVEFINSSLKGDSDMANVLPIDLKGNALFDSIAIGVVLCKLANLITPQIIDPGKIKLTPKSAFEQNDNHQLFLAIAPKLGIQIVSVGGDNLNAKTPHLVLGIVWQVVRASLVNKMKNLVSQSELDKNGLGDWGAPELVLQKWFNMALKNAGVSRTVTNFGPDLADTECYAVLLSQLAPEKCDLKKLESILKETNLFERAEMMLKIADELECRKFVTPKDIVEGNPRLNLAFVATLFQKMPNLGPTRLELSEQRVKELENQIQKNNSDLQSALAEHSRIQKEIGDKHEVEIGTRQQQIDQTSSELQLTQQKFDELSKREQSLVVSLDNSNQEIAKLKARIAELEAELAKERTEKAALQARIAELEKQLQSEQQAKQVSVQSGGKLQEELDKEKHENATLKSRVSELESKLAALSKEMQSSLAQAEQEKLKVETEKDIALGKLTDLISGCQQSGWLQKQGGTGLKSGWKRRYIILKDNVLAWAKEDTAGTKPLGFVYVENARIYKLEEKEAKKAFVFELQSEGTSKRFACANENEMKDWVNAINKAKAKQAGLKQAASGTTPAQGGSFLKI